MKISVLLLLLASSASAQSLPIVKVSPPEDTSWLKKVVVTTDNAPIYGLADGSKPIGRAVRGSTFYVTSDEDFNGKLLIESKDKAFRWIAKADVAIDAVDPDNSIVLVPQKARVSESPWHLIGSSGDRERDIYHREYFRRYDTVESWVKWVVRRPMSGKGRLAVLKRVSYYLQYASADCDRRRLSLTNTIFYDNRGRDMFVPFASAFGSYGEPLLPNSVAEMIWKSLCRLR
jgi:hypothetical protein